MAGKVTVCYTGNEVPDVVKKDRDFTTNGELRALIELVYSYGVKCSEIEQVLGYRSGAISYACDLGKVSLPDVVPGTRKKTLGIKLLKDWVKNV